MKTAMQELIEYLRSLAFTKCHLGMGDIMLTQGHIDELEEKFIEKEKEQIVEAANYGLEHFGDIAEKYYNEKYNK